MRTNYPLDKIVRRKDEERRRFILALGVIGVVSALLFFNGSVRLGLNKILIMATKPLWIVEGDTLVLGGDLFSFLRFHKGLVEENRRLKEQVFQLNIDLATNKLLERDYEKLSAIVGRSTDKAIPVVAKVILKPDQTPYDLIVVDIGSEGARPISVGHIARVGRNVTLGRVVNVSGKTATVELFSSPGLQTAVLVGPDRVQATAIGRGGGNMLLEIPRGISLNYGDEVILSANANSLIGLIGPVINNPNEPAQKILVSLPVNPFNLSWIEIYEY